MLIKGFRSLYGGFLEITKFISMKQLGLDLNLRGLSALQLQSFESFIRRFQRVSSEKDQQKNSKIHDLLHLTCSL